MLYHHQNLLSRYKYFVKDTHLWPVFILNLMSNVSRTSQATGNVLEKGISPKSFWIWQHFLWTMFGHPVDFPSCRRRQKFPVTSQSRTRGSSRIFSVISISRPRSRGGVVPEFFSRCLQVNIKQIYPHFGTFFCIYDSKNVTTSIHCTKKPFNESLLRHHGLIL